MSYIKSFFLSLFVIISTFYACSEDEVEQFDIDYGYEYFPLIVGKNKIYQVDSITFDTILGKTKVDSVRFFLMESIVEKYTNALGDTVFRIERYTRNSDTQPWKLKDVVSAEKNEQTCIRSEQNFRLIKLAFPLNIRSHWNPVLHIDKDVEVKAGNENIKMFLYWKAEVDKIENEKTILGKKYANVISVFQANSENAIELRRVTERYAKGIGLISNEMEILDTQTISGAPWRKKAQQGFILKQYLISY